MSDDPKRPRPARPPPLPRPTLKSAPEHRASANEQLRALQDHPPSPRFGDEGKTSKIGRLEADVERLRRDLGEEARLRRELVAALQRRDVEKWKYDQAVGKGVALIAREIGVEAQLPEVLRASVRPPPLEDAAAPAPPSSKPIIPAIGRDAATSARRANIAVFFAGLLTIAELVREVLHHIPSP